MFECQSEGYDIKLIQTEVSRQRSVVVMYISALSIIGSLPDYFFNIRHPKSEYYSIKIKYILTSIRNFIHKVISKLWARPSESCFEQLLKDFPMCKVIPK